MPDKVAVGSRSRAVVLRRCRWRVGRPRVARVPTGTRRGVRHGMWPGSPRCPPLSGTDTGSASRRLPCRPGGREPVAGPAHGTGARGVPQRLVAGPASLVPCAWVTPLSPQYASLEAKLCQVESKYLILLQEMQAPVCAEEQGPAREVIAQLLADALQVEGPEQPEQALVKPRLVRSGTRGWGGGRGRGGGRQQRRFTGIRDPASHRRRVPSPVLTSEHIRPPRSWPRGRRGPNSARSHVPGACVCLHAWHGA